VKTSIFDNDESLQDIARRRAEINISEHKGCQRCGTTVGVVRYHQNTMYHYEGTLGDADDPNYVSLCPPCTEENDEYWRGMWEEYYRGLL
jgi:hypothetical protein